MNKLFPKGGFLLLTVSLLAISSLFVTSPVFAATVNVSDQSTLQAAINAASPGDTIVFNSDITISSEVNVTQAVTIDGAGNHLKATFAKTSNSNNAAIGITHSNVTIKNLIEDGTGSTSLHGINIYQSTGITLDTVTVSNNGHDGVVVNGSIVTVNNITTSNNGWGGMDVDLGSGVVIPAVLTVNGTSSHSETSLAILIDDTTKNVSVIDTNNQYFFTNPSGNARVYTLKNNQNITFGTLSDKTFGDADFTVSASASSGLPVSFSSQTSSVCTVSGTTIHIIATGTCTVRASQSGDGSHNAAGNVDQSFNVVAAANQVIPDSSTGVVTINTTTPEVLVTNPTQAVTVTIDSSTTDPTLNFDALITNGTGTLPAVNITSANANNTNVEIPASTTVTSTDTSWNGVIAAPTVTTVELPTSPGITQITGTAIEVGFTGAKLSFDKGIRILLTGQAGKRAGYVRTGTAFTEITNICAADDQATGDALVADGDCKIDVGSDLALWTKHFTTFASFSSSSTNSGGGGLSSGGGGGGGNPAPVAAPAPTVTVTPSAPASVGQVLGATTIIGCGNRTDGFSMATGQSCIGNVPTPAPAGQVLGAQSFHFSLTLRQGSRGNEVKELQKFLSNAGYNVGTADGVFGAKVRAAVIKFQLAYKLKGDGVVGPAVRALLNK